MADLHPEVEKMIEAGPLSKRGDMGFPRLLGSRYVWKETPEEFACRIALRAVKLEREALRDAVVDELLEADATWSRLDALEVADAAIRREGGEVVKPHYFEDSKPDADDFMLQMAISQGYVPRGCLLGGMVVMDETTAGRDACAGCNGPRHKCGGREQRNG